MDPRARRSCSASDEFVASYLRVTAVPGEDDGLHLLPLPEQLARPRSAGRRRVLAMVDAEHGRWRQLHDRPRSPSSRPCSTSRPTTGPWRGDRPADRGDHRPARRCWSAAGSIPSRSPRCSGRMVRPVGRRSRPRSTETSRAPPSGTPARSGGRYWRDNPGRREGRRRRGPRRAGWAAAVLRAVRADDHGARRRRVDRRPACRAGRAVHVAGAVRAAQHAVQPPSTASTVPVT